MADLSAPIDVGNAEAQRQPLEFPIRLALLGSEHLKVARVIHRRLDAQPVSPFVVGFNRVGFDAMFDPDPFGSILEVAGDFSLKIAVDFSSQEAHHIATGEGLNAMENQSRINRCDIGGFSERHIGRPFALKDRPVIASPESTKHPGVGRVELARHARQRFVPRNAQLPFHQLLGFGKIVDPGKTVIVATIAHAVPVHHPGQPLPSVEADWDGKREPGLDAGTHPTELIINPVVI